MQCEFIGGPENGQRDDVADGCDIVYCAGLSRDAVDWYERNAESHGRFLHRGQISTKEYMARTAEQRKLKEIEAAFNCKPEDVPIWAR
jgi:hypothetical protein